MRSARGFSRVVRFVFAGIDLLATAAESAEYVRPVGDIRPGSAGSVSVVPAAWGLAGTHVVLAADDGVNGLEPWWIDAATPAVGLVQNIRGNGSSLDSSFLHFWNFAERTMFLADDGFDGRELWITDGTGPGTQMVTDLTGGPGGSTIASVTIDRELGYFNYLGDLWKTDGTGPGTTMVADISQAFSLVVLYRGWLIFDAGAHLWKSDGTGPGTAQITAAVQPRFSDSAPVVFHGALYFVGSDANGIELWRTDGTAGNTGRVVDIVAGAGSSNPRNLTVVDDLLFFTAAEPTHGEELWVYDGTTAPVAPVLDIWPGNNGSQPKSLFALGGKLYFNTTDGSNGHELWVSDGTAVGTHMVLDVVPGSGESNPGGFRRAGDRLLYLARTAPPSKTLVWLSDGTAAGTHAIDPDSLPGELSTLQTGDWVYAIGGANSASYEPWSVDLYRLAGTKFCSAPKLAIADADVVRPTLDRIRLAAPGTLLDLDVELDVGHEFAGDLTVTLTHVETATTILLVETPGSTSCSGRDVAIVLDDEAAADADSGCANADPAFPRRSHWRPSQSLAAFDGDALAGTWVLSVEDTAAGHFGVLRGWCLDAHTDLVFAEDFESSSFGGWGQIAP
jgi:ELWxxDGT repeat protein